MAKRYGGAHSPQPQTSDSTLDTPPRGSFQGAKRSRVGMRLNLLFIAPLPLIWRAFASGEATGLAMNLAALGLLLLAAWLTREGLLAQEAYEARKRARRPALPRKIIGALATGLGLGVAGFAAGGGILAPAIYAVLGVVLHQMAFGPDPLTNKGMDGTDHHQSDRVARAVTAAEAHLQAMSDAVARLGDPGLRSRVEGFQATARDLFRTVEDDPRDLTEARKYLGIYLKGAREATETFADLYARTRDADARVKFEGLLADLEQNFAARTRKLLLDDKSDFTIEAEVLRERLAREGL